MEARMALRTWMALATCILLAVLASPTALGHGSLASGEGHDNPTTSQLLLTPLVVGMIHVVAMVALLVMAYRARGQEHEPSPEDGGVPEGAQRVFGQFVKEDDPLRTAFQPNRRMYLVSKNLPHFFVLTGLAAFFSVYTYKWLGDLTVFVYTTVHATAILVLFAHSTVGWRRAWYGISPKALYSSFGTLGTLAISMPLRDLESIEVRQSRLKGLLDVSSLRLVFRAGKQKARVDMMMRAIDGPDRVREMIWDAARNSKVTVD